MKAYKNLFFLPLLFSSAAFAQQKPNILKLDGPYDLELKGFTDALVLLCPINQGWAVVGRADKYLSPAAFEKIVTTPKTLEVMLLEAGPLVIWSASGRPACENLVFADLGGGFWKADMPVMSQAAKFVITR